jgi:hypothetical protein
LDGASESEGVADEDQNVELSNTNKPVRKKENAARH